MNIEGDMDFFLFKKGLKMHIIINNGKLLIESIDAYFVE